MGIFLRLAIACCGLILLANQAFATHAMGADLSYRCLGSNNYEVTLSFYRDCQGVPPSFLYFVQVGSASCGQNRNVLLSFVSAREVSPLCPSQIGNSICNLGGTLPGVEEYIFRGTVVLPSTCNDWLFRFAESSRNNAITTINNAGNTDLYVEALLNQSAGICNASPVFTTPPVPYLCQGQPFVYNHGAVDPDGDSLVYSIVDALEANNNTVNYIPPYSGINPIAATPQAVIDPRNGTITLSPTMQQVGVLAVKVEEFRNGQLIGSTIRDIQLTVIPCVNQTPMLGNPLQVQGGLSVGPRRLELCADSVLRFSLVGNDLDIGDSIFISLDNLPTGMTSVIRGTNPDTIDFVWNPPPGANGLTTFFITLSDNACPIVGSQTIGIELQILNGTTLGNDQTICLNSGSATLAPIGGSTYNWQVLSGDMGSLPCTTCPSVTVSPNMTTTYVVSSNFPCNPMDTITVNVINGITVDAGSNMNLCDSGVVSLNGIVSGGSGYVYSWSPGSGLSNASIINPVVAANSSQRYFLTVTTPAGCISSDSVDVMVSAPLLEFNPVLSNEFYCGDSAVTGRAQGSNGDCEAYSLTSIPHAPLPLGASTLSLGDDQNSSAIPLGFDFDFFCNTYSAIYASSNGWISFSPTTVATLTGTTLPNATNPNAIIALAWEDLNPAIGGSIRYGTTGTAPNRVFTLNFDRVPHCCTANNPAVSVQLVLYEGSDVIEIHNIDVNADGGNMVQGIENPNGTRAYWPIGKNNTQWSAQLESWRFTPVPPQPFTVTWETIPLGTILTGDSVSFTPAVTTNYRAIITDNGSGCADTASFTISVPDIALTTPPCIAFGDPANLAVNYIGPAIVAKCDTYLVESITYNRETLTSPTAIALGDDQVQSNVPIGFDLDFYCNTYNQFNLSSNGWLSFLPTFNSNFSNTAIPNNSTPNALIAFGWDDLNPGLGGTIRYQTLGTAPFRRFVLEFFDVPRCCAASNPKVSTQVILYETTNNIEFHIIDIQQDPFDDMVLGIENIAGTDGVAVPGRNNVTFGASQEAWRFRPKGGILTYDWTPKANIVGDQSPNPRVSPPIPTWYTVTVNNGFCELVDSVLVCMTTLNQGWEFVTSKSEGTSVVLNWKADFSAASSYVIEYAFADEQEFTEVASVDAHMGVHAWRHSGLLPGEYQYRIRAVSAGGTFSISPLTKVSIAPSQPHILPNPAHDFVEIRASLKWEILDMNGRLVLSGQSDEVQEAVRVSLEGLAPGVYVYKITGRFSQQKGKLVVW
ncbi:MAG: T9SS type A sorting domain-containing protein [Bacteroidia bacterium]